MGLGQDYYGEPRDTDLYSHMGKAVIEDVIERRQMAHELMEASGYKDWRRNAVLVKAYDDYIKRNIDIDEFASHL